MYKVCASSGFGNNCKKSLIKFSSYLKEFESICSKEDCRFLFEFYPDYYLENTQFLKEYMDYILNNYELCYEDFVYCRKINYCPLEINNEKK